MRRALSQARRASGRTHPNPPVGAIVYRGDRVLGRGCTRPIGGAHAEVVAIERAIRRHGARAVRGASLAVTLEPCSHTGRTAPCADRVIDAGLSLVLIGHRDPHAQVAGAGLRRLRRAGIRVEVGILEDECRQQHRGFLSVCERGRPFVSLKLASTLDGRIATAAGQSRWITGPEARAVVHRLRARSDAVMVGSATALADDPTLTARRAGRVVHRPVRVVVDAKLAIPPTAKLHRGSDGGSWVLCSPGAAAGRRRRLEDRGVRVLEVPLRGGHVDLARGLRRLAKEGVTEVLVEGGGELAAGLVRRGLVDELHWFSAPCLLGGDALPALGVLGVSSLARAPRLEDVRVRRVGRDVWVRGMFSRARNPKDSAR